MSALFKVAVAGSLGLFFLSAPALAATPGQPVPVSPRKQLSGCMNRQMSASRSISYNEAMKVCKALIKSQEENLVASNEAKPAHAR
jgi:hypothetical protein